MLRKHRFAFEYTQQIPTALQSRTHQSSAVQRNNRVAVVLPNGLEMAVTEPILDQTREILYRLTLEVKGESDGFSSLTDHQRHLRTSAGQPKPFDRKHKDV